MERDPMDPVIRPLDRDVERAAWGKSWDALGAMEEDGVTVGRERLDQMASAALADAAAEPPASSRSLRRWVGRLAAAAGLLVALSLGVRFLVNRPAGERELAPLPPPACLEDPEFVTNFELIRDLPELDADGDPLDVDDELLLLQALEGA